MITLENTKTVYDLITAAGREYSERIFCKFEDNDAVTAVTYSQFVRESMGIAAWIEEQNAAAGHKIHIALLGTNSHRYLNALVGALINGNTVVPLDPQLDTAVLADNLKRSDSDILIYDWEYNDVVKEAVSEYGLNIKCICFQTRERKKSFRQIRDDYLGMTVDPSVSPDDLAVIIFTSGTTGRGKGVMLSQGNIIDNVFCTETIPGKSEWVFLSVLPVHHVFCFNTDMLLAFRYGYLLCLNKDMKKLIPHMKLFKPTNVNMVPMVARLLFNRYRSLQTQHPEMSVNECKAEIFGPNIRMIDCGGGYLDPELAQSYLDLGISIRNGYGMSECSPKITAADHSRPDKITSVGRVVLRCDVKIKDGEILVKSPSVMQGYYGDPEETAKTIDKDGYLHTGDFGYLDEENFLYFTGRKKNLIVLSNGENVAPEEIENMFNGEQIVEDVLVFDDNDTLACAVYPNYLYISDNGISDPEKVINDITAKINEKLSSYKKLHRVIIKKTPFKKTTSKKIIRQAFIDELNEKKNTESVMKLPETEIQKKIMEIVVSITGRSDTGTDSDLFSCGLDSLGSIMLLTELYNTLNMTVTLKNLSENPTVLKLEKFYCEHKEDKGTDLSIRETYPLTNLQTYFAYVLKGNTSGNIPFLFRLSEETDIRRLKKAVEKVFDIHPELKATVMKTESGLVWKRDDDREIKIPVIETDSEEWSETVKELVVPYQYDDGEDMFHIAVYNVVDDGCYLFADFAHIISDGVSAGLILQDIDDIYNGKTLNKEKNTFYEYILEDAAINSDSERREKDIQYFKMLSEGFRIRKSILTTHEKYDIQNAFYAYERNAFEKLNQDRISAFCKKNGISENVLFLTAFNLCISLFSNEDDTVSASIHSGRTDSRWNRITGPLFTTYIFRNTISDTDDSVSLIRRNAAQILKSMESHVTMLHPDEMFFQYQGDILNRDRFAGGPVKMIPFVLQSLPFHLQMFSSKKGYSYELRYWSNRFDTDLLKIFMECFESYISALTDGCRIRDLRDCLDEHIFPKHFTVNAADLSLMTGRDIVCGTDPDTKVRVYVLDNKYRKLPFGGWGDLYIADIVPVNYSDILESPYRPGRLYKTDICARLLPDGKADMLDSNGRTVMIDGVLKRTFPDLYTMEKLLEEYHGIETASCYVSYDVSNKFVLTCDIKGQHPDMDDLKTYMETLGHPELVPEVINLI